MKKFHIIYLYGEPSTENLQVKELGEYLKGKLPGLKTEVRQDFFLHHLKRFTQSQMEERIEILAEGFARTRVHNIGRDTGEGAPLPMEIQYEIKNIENPAARKRGILYDGFYVQNLLKELIPAQERTPEHIHINFTNQLLGTMGDDNRYHTRVAIYGYPVLISTTGVVEAPAKPKEFYVLKEKYHTMGMGEVGIQRLKEEFREKFIDYNDSRLTEVLKGYVLQTLFYYLAGDPFCQDKNCRLFNAHWQEEMIHAQLKTPYELCTFHRGILERMIEEEEINARDIK
ncbi:hypothetical protein COY52_02085 [Candidatus Desantisbacteria bacterium CG_4_10_14_0_8_um_filter_48_22]|uniref:Uncharacterized protein n=1 Tax=Candidatus Desantisbacteria bacterium CG_4_10_14_0_8_um_filter_48_22 TaxID=1974543 RepID=A0A2M7SEL3_9BACT|nr:MAG: hypothetical protein AUJ67_04540 [Candidatus Desantisbacteria bacterium CG1_02_49_89]PIV55589.1 MAG: hypothetical protein COS16_06550 [Candidatus Desantisbacteria bacterium CG02_land_8_20_14_3_00_49_13]PIZ17946.1 MAG: hypothetical protein COY52_02085 [Candidatus Desantisbacteria bacterium CG_4_10_14_0_8_um_filter_48_22]